MTEFPQESSDGKLQDLMDQRRKLQEKLNETRSLIEQIDGSIRELSSDPVGSSNIENENQRISTGFARLDDLLHGGYPSSSNILLSGPPYSSKFTLANRFIVSSLKESYPVVIVSMDKPISEIKSDLYAMGISADSYEDSGYLKFVDAYSRSIQMDNNDRNAIVLDNVSNISNFLKAMDQNCSMMLSSMGKYRMVFFSLTAWITQSSDDKLFPKALQHFSQRRKMEGSTTLYLIEDGIFQRSLYENMNYFMDGSVEFRTESSAEYLRVRGMKEAQSRDWIEVVHNGNDLTLGSFELKRIR